MSDRFASCRRRSATPKRRACTATKTSPREWASRTTVRHRQDVDQNQRGPVYLQAAQNGLSYGALRPTSRLTTSATRTWNDANKNFVPDCDLLNGAANGECQPISTSAFGKNVFTNTLDQSLVNGWSVRPADWESAPPSSSRYCPASTIELRLQPTLAHQFHGDRQPGAGAHRLRNVQRRRANRPSTRRRVRPDALQASTTSTRTWRRRSTKSSI